MADMRSKLGNPWSAEEWNLTRQGEFIKMYGEGRARVFAKAAGTTIGALKPSPVPTSNRTFIYTKRLVSDGSGGGGIIGAGSSSDGPPE